VRAGRTLAGGGPLPAWARQPIGRVLSRPGLWLCRPDGSRQRLLPQGWQHVL
jgi:hypothetical protein